MASVCTADTCSIVTDTTNGVLALDARIAPAGGLQCIGDGNAAADGLATKRLFNIAAVANATAVNRSDRILPLKVTDQGRLFIDMAPVWSASVPAGNQVSIIIGTSAVSQSFSHTNTTNSPQMVHFRCTQPQINVSTIAGGGAATQFEGVIRLDSNLADATGGTDILQRNDKTFMSPGAGNVMLWYHEIGGSYIVQPGQTLTLELRVVASALDNLDTAAPDRGFRAIGSYVVIFPYGVHL